MKIKKRKTNSSLLRIILEYFFMNICKEIKINDLLFRALSNCFRAKKLNTSEKN